MRSTQDNAFSVLILDDEYDKIQAIIRVLENSGVSADSVTQVSNVNEARRRMRENHYDLLIVDMNVPVALGTPPRQNGGIELLKLIRVDVKVRHPGQVIGITAKDDIFSDAEREMKMLSWTLCLYDPTSNEWEYVLKEKVEHSLRSKAAESFSVEKADIVLVTALRQTEFEAVLKLPYDWQELTVPNDSTNYYKGQLKTKFGTLKVVAACALRMGMPSASALATKMAMVFEPKLIAMLGICAGKKGTVGLGDVIIGDPVWDWGSGKYKDVKGVKTFAIAPHQLPLDSKFRGKILDIKDRTDISAEIRSGWHGEVPAGKFGVHIGPMASGASVVSDSDIMSDIEKQNRNLIAVEMEAYAVMAAAEYTNQPGPSPIVIKSVCDFGDATKHSKWQKYAAYTSASFFNVLFRDHLQL
jgi:nucleoside phosphorylase